MARTAWISPAKVISVGNQYERRRLEQRATRLARVVAVLRERASASSHSGPIPRGLQQAIADFQAELSHVRGRLHGEHAGGRRLAGDPPPPASSVAVRRPKER